MTLDNMTLDAHIRRLQTCTNDVHCKKEKSCFIVAQYAYEQLELEKAKDAKASIKNIQITEDDGLDYFQSPHWELATNF